MTSSTYSVTGMTCANCTRHVAGALRELPGVHDVEVSLEGGTARVESAHALDEAAVRAALEEAGYSLA
jgi:copper chaperone CopZ